MTDVQLQILKAMASASRVLLEAGCEPDLTTRDLTELTGRVGQVLGCSCGYMVTYGWLTRTAPATYRLTLTGIAALKAALA